jgi:hypothetical protein
VHRHLLWIPLLAALIASALFLAQDGLGGGHGDFDRLIWLLGLPGVLLAEWAPAPLTKHDLLLLVLWPAIWNALFWAAIAKGVSAFQRHTR